GARDAGRLGDAAPLNLVNKIRMPRPTVLLELIKTLSEEVNEAKRQQPQPQTADQAVTGCGGRRGQRDPVSRAPQVTAREAGPFTRRWTAGAGHHRYGRR
ncbi:hypothetical protein, partial [Streptomyces sp. NPDC005167]